MQVRHARPTSIPALLAAGLIASIGLTGLGRAQTQATGGSPEQGQARASAGRYDDGLRRWTSADSVSLRYPTRYGEGFETPDTIALRVDEEARTSPILWSPGRTRFLVITYNGDLGCDCLRYRLDVHDAGRIAQALQAPAASAPPAPIASAAFETRSSTEWMAGISQPRWVDEDHVLFVGVEEGLRQLFRLDAATEALARLTQASTPFDPEPRPGDDQSGRNSGMSYYALAGGTLVYGADRLVRRTPLIAAYPSISVADEQLMNLYFRSSRVIDLYLSTATGRQPGPVAQCVAPGSSRGRALSVSPDGHWAVFTCQRIAAAGAATAQSGQDAVPPLAFWLLDARTARVTPIATAVAGARYDIAWRGDSALVALGGVVSDRCATPAGTAAAQVAILDPARDALSCIAQGRDAPAAPSRMAGLRWERDGAVTLSFEGSDGAAGIEQSYARQRGGWRQRAPRPVRLVPPSPPAPAGGLSVHLVQSASQPWSIVAEMGGRTLAITAPDPALAGLWRAPVREVSWREGDVIVHGGLVLPRDHQPGIRLPLVIQVGAYLPNQFLADGSASTVFAAQSLAAQGLAVLNIDFRPVEGQQVGTPGETGQAGGSRLEDMFRARIDAIVETLGAEGLIDPARVGLVGFSHTGFQTHYLATHPGRTRLAAAIVADSWTAGYGDYVFAYGAALASRNLATITASYFGGSFWDRRASWLERSPLFNVQQVSAPVLFQLHADSLALPFAAETVGAYRLMRKPFDFFIFPAGAHQLRRPRERVASMDNNISWMAFWLQGRELPGLQSEETYARWRRMRQQRDTQAGSPVTPAQ